MHRAMSTKSNSSSFSAWFEDQKAAENPGGGNEENQSLLGQMGSIQDNFANQLQALSGTLPEAGVLSTAYRERITHSLYLLAASVLFAFLTIFLGLPTMLVRPSKFVVCLSLSTIFAAASVIVMQKPSVFWANVISGGFSTAVPIFLLAISTLSTLYITLFIHKYLYIIISGTIQLGCLLFYMASFIPGGTQGLIVLLRTMAVLVSTMLKPFIYMARKTITACISKMSS